jgi:ABC-type antimicrobial peptide transport system permease subunit
MRQGALLSISGIVLGLGAAWAGTRYLSSFLFGIGSTDPVTYVVAALFMTVVATAATYLPARRATAINPVLALRQE